LINFSKNTRLYFSFFHLLLGVILLTGLVAKVYSGLVVFFGILFIIKNKNKNNDAIFWSAYMIGAEVLFRMSGGMFFHELPKYSVFLFLVTGLIVEQKRHHVSVSYLIYMLLLLIGIAFIDIPFNESIRKAIAFNLSGPILLGLSAIYFNKRELSLDQVLNMLFIMVLPIISMLSLLYFKTPDLETIRFGSQANFATSGGFGPNQVGTILGMGVFIFGIHLFLKNRIFSILIIDLFMFIYLVYRSLITLSRGGILTAFIVLIVFLFFYILTRRVKVFQIIKYTGLTILFGIVLVIYSADVTNGMLINRYTNKNASGVVKADVSAGRAEIFVTEIEGFIENPIFGLGVGGSKYYRLEELDKFAASHNEISRLIAEHGLIGIFVLLMLLAIPIRHILKQPFLAMAFLSSFLIFWFLTINHSAMRIAFPAFIYGLSLVVINNKTNELNK